MNVAMIGTLTAYVILLNLRYIYILSILSDVLKMTSTKMKSNIHQVLLKLVEYVSVNGDRSSNTKLGCKHIHVCLNTL